MGAGVVTIKNWELFLATQGRRLFWEPLENAIEFRFGNSSTARAVGIVVIPLGFLYRFFVLLRVYVLPRNAPLLWANPTRKAMQIDALCSGTYHARLFERDLTSHAVPSGHDIVKADEYPPGFKWSEGAIPNYENDDIQIYDAENPVLKKEDTKRLEVVSEDC